MYRSSEFADKTSSPLTNGQSNAAAEAIKGFDDLPRSSAPAMTADAGALDFGNPQTLYSADQSTKKLSSRAEHLTDHSLPNAGAAEVKNQSPSGLAVAQAPGDSLPNTGGAEIKDQGSSGLAVAQVAGDSSTPGRGTTRAGDSSPPGRGTTQAGDSSPPGHGTTQAGDSSPPGHGTTQATGDQAPFPGETVPLPTTPAIWTSDIKPGHSEKFGANGSVIDTDSNPTSPRYLGKAGQLAY